jgi:hypothetical protein
LFLFLPYSQFYPTLPKQHRWSNLIMNNTSPIFY